MDFARRVRRAVEQDGLFELAMGIVFLAVPLLVHLRLQALAGVLSVVIITIVLPAVRSRVTYPRVGYAKPREQAFPVILLYVLGLAGASLGLMALVLLAQGRVGARQAWSALMPFGVGLFLAGCHLLWGLRTGATRYFILAGAAAAGGAAAVLAAGGSLDIGAGVFFIGFGLLELVVGTVLFVRFLASHPVPTEAGGDA